MEKRIAGGILILCVIVGLLTIPFVNVANAADERTEWNVTFSGNTEADGLNVM